MEWLIPLAKHMKIQQQLQRQISHSPKGVIPISPSADSSITNDHFESDDEGLKGL